jgi:hypothetical protein
MPNWPISDTVRSYIASQALILAKRPLDYALADFPLTTAQVQSIVLPAEQISTMRRLESQGVRTIEHHRQVRLAFLREKFPELKRGAVVSLQLPEWIYVGRGTNWGIDTTKFKMDESHYIVPDMDELDPRDRRELVVWITRAVRQKRLWQIVDKVVPDVLRNHAATAAHLHAFWPMLTTLVTNVNNGYPKTLKAWEERFKNPTRSLRAYQPDPQTYEKYRKVIQAADAVITAGKILDSYVTDRKLIQADIEHWESRDGDLVFPLV